METKEQRYRQLIGQVKKKYPVLDEAQPPEKKALYWFRECDEINLWTYWQGRGQLDADIMLVGQDWGNPWEDSCKSFCKKLSQPDSGRIRNYMEGNNNPTDKNLVTLFKVLGFDIEKPCDRLFFTNFVLGYRNYKISGGYRRQWTEDNRDFFRQLAEIIEPEVVLCLGRTTFQAVMQALEPQKKLRIGRYNTFLTSAENPRTVRLSTGKTLRVYALAHCGAIGTMNRNRGTAGAAGLTLQIEDWKRIGPL